MIKIETLFDLWYLFICVIIRRNTETSVYAGRGVDKRPRGQRNVRPAIKGCASGDGGK